MSRRQPHEVGKLLQRSFDHLVVKGRKRDNKRAGSARIARNGPFVHAEDRVPLWNIAPGDRVYVNAGSKKGSFGTVEWVNREQNRVYLAEPEFAREKRMPSSKKGELFNNPDFRPDSKALFPIPIHYSNVSLVLQRSPEAEVLAAAAQEERGESGPLPEVVAKRVSAQQPHYNWRARRWMWKRIAKNIVEVDPATGRLRHVELPSSDLAVPFPREQSKRPKNPAPMDTTIDVVAEDTFNPSLDAIAQPPPELDVRQIEFGNPFSRARRQRRWNEENRI